MSFDLLAWCEEHLDGEQSGAEFPAVCPFCGRAQKFSVNHERALYRCFHSSCKSGHAAFLISHVEGISIRDAFARFELNALESDAKPAYKRRECPEKRPELWAIETPPEFIPCHDETREPAWRVIKALDDRFERSTLKAFGVGFCHDGDFRGRYVIPVVCPNGRAFVARCATGEHATNPKRPKHRNAGGKWARDLIFGWPQFQARLALEPKLNLVLVEGPGDAMRYFEHGIAAIALLGKELGSGQLDLILSLGCDTRIILSLDPEERREYSDKIAEQLIMKFKIYIAAPLAPSCEVLGREKIDPGNSTRNEAYASIDGARAWA